MVSGLEGCNYSLGRRLVLEEGDIMYQEQVILCASSKYEEKYYLNEDFENLPQSIQRELQIMCVLFTEEIGGILTLEYDAAGNLNFITAANEGDLLYDDIGSALKIKQMREERKELLESLEAYYRVFFLGETLDTDSFMQ